MYLITTTSLQWSENYFYFGDYLIGINELRTIANQLKNGQIDQSFQNYRSFKIYPFEKSPCIHLAFNFCSNYYTFNKQYL